MSREERGVIGPANHHYAWVTFVKEHTTAMVLRKSIPMTQADQSKQGQLCSQVDQVVNVAAVVFLPFSDGTIDTQVGLTMSACYKKCFRPEVLQALADRSGGFACHSPNPICTVCVGTASPIWLVFTGHPTALYGCGAICLRNVVIDKPRRTHS